MSQISVLGQNNHSLIFVITIIMVVVFTEYFQKTTRNLTHLYTEKKKQHHVL